ncbi:RNA pseudouridine synthase [Malikia sp.]|uniref:RNA pseudouridine synthase n=1 Tax=Malikia sp. TaxID=2070706 RepID=UPI002638EDB7|nr:RNA pseudouridine synthase [Malikia sp.]MDD2730433.1 RNA pseudouridine synthase [Malikia sp.]
MSEPKQKSEGERLAKRVATLQACSRAEAERLIEGGWVRVDGVIADDPARRVSDEAVEVDAKGLGETLTPLTLLWHKPAGVALAEGQPLAGLVQPEGLLRPWHVKHLRCASPMPAACSGLAVFAQSPGVQRKLHEDALLLEHEWMLDLAGAVPAAKLEALEQEVDRLAPGPRTPYLKLSVSSRSDERTRLRLALKAYAPERLPSWLAQACLKPQALQRMRLGRVALGQVQAGEWRLLGLHERF